MPFDLKGCFDSVLKSSLKFIVGKWCLTQTPRCPESVGQKLSTAKSRRAVGCKKPMELSAMPHCFQLSLSSFEARQK